jgi:hypothetical protein
MNSQLLNLPAAAALSASVFMAQKIDCGTPNANSVVVFGVKNSNAINVAGLRLPSIDFAALGEANVVESKTENSEQSEMEMNFNRLSQKWKAETGGYSSVGSIVMHPAYLEIISHGEKMIPFILKDLQAKPSHWFIALKTLAKTSPVNPEDAGNIKKMTAAWLAWGRANGKLS